MPSPEVLIPDLLALEGCSPASTLRWAYEQLHAGRLSSNQQQQQPGQEAMSQEDFAVLASLMWQGCSSSSSANTSASASTSSPRSVLGRRAALAEAAAKAQLNAYAEPHPDTAAAALSGGQTPGAAVPEAQVPSRTKLAEPQTTPLLPTRAGKLLPQSLTGIWPAMAMINHSCSPNACTIVLARSTEGVVGLEGQQQQHKRSSGARARVMVVRAARPLEAGEEVTISYAGEN